MQPTTLSSPLIGRRGFLSGFGGIALASLLARDGLLRANPNGAAHSSISHHAPRARRAIHMFLQGGLSQVDSFDYKPDLEKHHGQTIASVAGGDKPDVFFNAVGLLHKPHFPFKQRGQSGLWISDLFPHIAEQADELTLIRSMVSDSGNHTPATYYANSGFKVLGFPAMGAWLSYGLGSLSENLPTFVVIPDPRSLPTGAANNWTSGFLPARHQGVLIQATKEPVKDLVSARPIEENTRLARYAMLEKMNRRHLAASGGGDALEGRIRSYELASRMQTTIPEATALDAEPEEIKRMYGFGDGDTEPFGRGALMARRLLERGVRFVQLWSGAELQGPTWDAHDNVPGNHSGEAKKIDKPIAGLLRDLRQRGMLEDTLVIFTTEFGRTPFAQTGDGQLGTGRDHNQTAFTSWLAGAGVKRGFSYGATDNVGWRATDKVVTMSDFHATILHLLGIDHERLTFYHNGIDRRLTNVSGRVVREIMG